MMIYHGPTELPESSAENGYWAKGNDVYDVSSTTHIRAIMSEPEKFGLSDLDIDNIYKKHNERRGWEGNAREEIIKMVSNNGWVRARHYIRPSDYWSIQADSTRVRKETIINFIWWAIQNKLMTPHDTVTIMGYNDPMDHMEFDYKEGGIENYLMQEATKAEDISSLIENNIIKEKYDSEDARDQGESPISK